MISTMIWILDIIKKKWKALPTDTTAATDITAFIAAKTTIAIVIVVVATHMYAT